MQKIVHTNIQRWKTLMKQKSRGDEKHFLLDIFLELASKHIFIIISNVVSLIAKVGSTRDDFVRLLWCWLQHAAFQRANSYFWLVDSENCCVCCDAPECLHLVDNLLTSTSCKCLPRILNRIHHVSIGFARWNNTKNLWEIELNW